GLSAPSMAQTVPHRAAPPALPVCAVVGGVTGLRVRRATTDGARRPCGGGGTRGLGRARVRRVPTGRVRRQALRVRTGRGRGWRRLRPARLPAPSCSAGAVGGG